jgi:tetratricopeptide (TPR) repeat protein
MMQRGIGYLCLCAAFLGMSAAAQAQPRMGHARLEGEVTPAGQGSGLTVELYDPSNNLLIERAFITHSGRFDFMNLSAGDFGIRLTDQTGNVITQEYIRVGDAGNFVTLRLPVQTVAAKAPPGTVSLSQLSHKVPKEARKQFEKSLKAKKKGRVDESIACLEKALEIDPDYMEAHVNLAAALLRKGQTSEAMLHLERAIELDPASGPAFLNLAIAYLEQGRPEDAERAARQAYKLDPTNPKPRYILALALKELKQEDEALRLLSTVEDEIPRARVSAARILAERGQNADAADELRQYLVTVQNEQERARVERWLARLTATSTVERPE